MNQESLLGQVTTMEILLGLFVNTVVVGGSGDQGREIERWYENPGEGRQEARNWQQESFCSAGKQGGHTSKIQFLQLHSGNLLPDDSELGHRVD